MSSKAMKFAASVVLLAGLVAASIAADQEPPPQEPTPQERIQVKVFDKPFDPPIGPSNLGGVPRRVLEYLDDAQYVGRVSFAEADRKLLSKARLAMVEELVNSKLKELKPHQDPDEYRDMLRRAIDKHFELRLPAAFHGSVSPARGPGKSSYVRAPRAAGVMGSPGDFRSGTGEVPRPRAISRAPVYLATGRVRVFGATPEAVEELARGFIASYDKQAVLAGQAARAELTQKQEHLSKLQQELDTAEKNYQKARTALAERLPTPKRLGEDLVAKQMMMDIERRGLEMRIKEAKNLLAKGKKSPSAQAMIEKILFEDQIKLAGLLGQREGIQNALAEYRYCMRHDAADLDTQKTAEDAVNELKYEKARTESDIKELAERLEAGFAPLKLTEPIQIRPVTKPKPGMAPMMRPSGAGVGAYPQPTHLPPR